MGEASGLACSQCRSMELPAGSTVRVIIETCPVKERN